MMSRTVACLAIWFIGIHGEQAGEDGPSGYDHHPKSCVSSHNIKSYTDRTPEQCAELCNIYGRGCKGFEIFVDYGIRSGRRDVMTTARSRIRPTMTAAMVPLLVARNGMTLRKTMILLPSPALWAIRAISSSQFCASVSSHLGSGSGSGSSGGSLACGSNRLPFHLMPRCK